MEGVLKQQNASLIEYNYDYSNQYNEHGIKNDQLSFLRLGYIIGSLNYIPENILDIGYGNGAFLKACNEIIKTTYGYDKSEYPVPEKSIKLNSPFKNKFDCVTLFDCLEH